MAKWWDARETPEGWRFRRWCSITDKYATDPLDEAAAQQEMSDDYSVRDVRSGHAASHIAGRLARAKVNGTTLLIAGCEQDIHGPWQTELCDDCGHFHHAFELRESDGMCASCGEREHPAGCVKDT